MVAGRNPSSPRRCGHQRARVGAGDHLRTLHSTHPPSARSRTGTGVIDFTRPHDVRDVVDRRHCRRCGTGYARSPVPPRSSSSGRPPTSASRRAHRVRPPSVDPSARWRPDSVASPLDGVAGSALGLLALSTGQLFLVRPQPRRRTAYPLGVRPTTSSRPSRRAPQARQFLADLHHVWLDGEAIVRVRSTSGPHPRIRRPVPAGSFVFESVVTMTLASSAARPHRGASAASVQRPAYPRLITLRAPC